MQQLPTGMPTGAELLPNSLIGSGADRSVASYERELIQHRSTEHQLREALDREEVLLRQKVETIQQQELLNRESEHRLLNDLQLIISLLSLQSRASQNAEAASQLAIAADRIATIGRVHRRLHSFDGLQTVAFKQYLEDLCRDFSTMLFSPEHPEQVIVLEATDLKLPASSGIPLGFIVNELLTNAAKHGNGRIMVKLEPVAERGYALSVVNDGPALPDDFDPAASTGLGMKIIRSLIGRINGELVIGCGDQNQGARFTVLFS